jgi:hypothetical protein
MSMTTDRPAMDLEPVALRLRMVAAGATLLLPIVFMASRAGSEGLVGLIGALFLLRSVWRRDWAWLRDGWVVAAGAWWGWMVLCSTPIAALGLGESGDRSLIQAVLLGRFFILAAALSTWLLRDARLRRTLFIVLSASAAWIVVECWQQYLFGTDIAGYHRWMDGALTGPFRQPKAGPQLVLMLFPAILPPAYALLRQRSPWRRACGVALFGVGIATMVLIGQRMPALLTGLGLLTCAFVLPRLRAVTLGAGAAALLLLAATPIVSPPTFQKLVVHFAQQMRHFPESDYGQLYVRATVMGIDHPYTGLGFDGFRDHCHAERYVHGLPLLGITNAEADGPAACNIHPHNHYLEAFTAGGLPGLLLFCVLVTSWLARLAGGVGRGRPEQVGCFVTVLLALWPLASTSAFFTLPNAGWLFLVLGAGLALTPPKRALAALRGRNVGYALPAGD